MKEKEARALGFEYTGMSTSEWNKEAWEKIKAKAQAIKKTWSGADYRVVDERCVSRCGSCVYKNIYGNEIFRKAQYYNVESVENYLNFGHAKNLVALQEEYKAKVAAEMEQYEREKAIYVFMMSIKKN